MPPRSYSDLSSFDYEPKEFLDISVARTRGVDVLHDPVFNKVLCRLLPCMGVAASGRLTSMAGQAGGMAGSQAHPAVACCPCSATAAVPGCQMSLPLIDAPATAMAAGYRPPSSGA